MSSPLPAPALLEAALRNAAYARREDRAFLRITGPDATRWLNGMVTNSIQALTPGRGSYSFLLNAQGRIQGDCTIYRDPDSTDEEPAYLLATGAAQLPAIQQHLDRFIIMDDVELTPVFTGDESLLLLGPEAPKTLASLALPAPAPLQLVFAPLPTGNALLFTSATPFQWELHASSALLSTLEEQLVAQHLPQLDATSLEQLRILQAIPLFGSDIRDRELPQETAQAHALHFNKGCYLGQEIVERIHSRGQVNRLFTPLRLEGELPTLPAPIEANGKPAGEITSAAAVALPGGPAHLALGFVRREALDSRTTLTYRGGTATPRVAGSALST